MFTWILIIFTIALIFGVIKIDQIKELIKKYEPQARELAKKYEPQARELLNKAKTVVEEKAAELKKNNEAKSTPANHEAPVSEVVEAPKNENNDNQTN